MLTMTLKELADKVVSDQNFNYVNFDDAKIDLDVQIDNIQYRLSYDRLTTTLYNCEPELDLFMNFKKLINAGLLRKLNREQMKCWYEYQALFWFCACNGLEYISITKSLRPDFIVIDNAGRRVGIEVMELTSEIDRKRQTIQRIISKLPRDAAEKMVTKHLKMDARKFEVKQSGSLTTLVPKEATCLTEQRVSNASKLFEKYEKYFIKDKIGTSFDEFIILGNALHSIIAITDKGDVEHILEELCRYRFCNKIGIVILFQDYPTRTICSKGVFVGA